MTERGMKIIMVLFVVASVVTIAILGSLVYVMMGYIENQNSIVEDQNNTSKKISEIYSILQGYEIKDIYIETAK